MKIIETITTTTEYRIIEETNGVAIPLSRRSATIAFRDGVFSQCSFAGVQPLYTLDDWHFLGILAARIGELTSESPVVK